MSNKKSFNEIINSDIPVLIDFTAAWCGPCKMMAPILKEVSGRIGEKGKIIKIDIDKNRSIAEKLHIMSVPTFMLYKNGKVLWKKSGVMSAKQLEEVILNAGSN
ncbi:MAG: thioredoxin [Saprospiraceae bacterium]|nr:thioredoxin [Saprospiraceae bacterium]